jgi:cysteine desulfurase
MTETLFLDHNAGSPPTAEVVQAVVQAMQSHAANPSSGHEPGQQARRALAGARAEVAALLGCTPAELVFTSGASEATAMALLGARRLRPQGRLVVSAVEHPGLLALGQRLRDEGADVAVLPVDSRGVVDLAAARRLVVPGVALVSVMAANHETGVLQPLPALAELCRAAGAWLHSDATQALGKAPLSLAGLDLASFSGHKVGAPQGVGALFVRKGLDWPAAWPGRQERGRRGGTENGPGIAGFAAVARALRAAPQADLARMAALRDRLEASLVRALGAQVLGAVAPRVANTTLLRLPGVPAEAALARLGAAGVAASSGAACHSGRSEPSHVPLAMGLAPEAALQVLRFSLGRDTTAEVVDEALRRIVAALAPLRAEALAAATA